jgi:hypothetical protein
VDREGILLLAVLAAVIVLANILATRRRSARAQETQSFASLSGFRSEGDANPFAGLDVKRVPIGPHILIDVAGGQGTIRNVMRGRTAAGEVILFDYRASVVSSGEGSSTFAAVAAFAIQGVPDLQIVPQARFTIGVKDLDFPSHPIFSRRFMLLAGDEAAVRKFFPSAVLDAIEALSSERQWHLQAGSGWLLVSFGEADIEELPELVAQGTRVAAAMLGR